MSAGAVAPLTAPAVDWGAHKPDDPAKAKDAAQQFEALLLAQMLKSVGESGGLFGSGSDAASGTVMDMATQQFALAMSRNGGLGLADMVARGLEGRRPTAPADPGSTSAPGLKAPTL